MVKLESFERSPRLSELKVVYRRSKPRKTSGAGAERQITSPATAQEYLRAIWNRDTIELYEEFVLVCLNHGHQPIGWVRLSSGGFAYAPIDLKLVFGIALQTAASAIIVAHNHPSGQLVPSLTDQAATRRLVDAGNLLAIRVLDHVIVTSGGTFSFSENGLMPAPGPDVPRFIQKEERSGGATAD